MMRTNIKKSKLYKLSNTKRCDILFLALVSIIAVFGTVMVFSAGAPYAEARYDDKYYFIKRQVIWVITGYLLMLLASKADIGFYKKYSPYAYAVTIALLLLVLLVGMVGNGAKRWISIGPLTIQPSEIAKLTMIMFLAWYFENHQEKATDSLRNKNIMVYGTLIPFFIILLPIALVALQKHLSCIVILGAIGLIMIFMSGANPKYLSIFCAIGIIFVLFIAFFTDYTKERIVVWQDPESYKLTGGWQTLQGLMAIGSGGIWGVGLGNSILKHCYVSEPANDMIFAILCEETGFVGAVITLSFFGALIVRGCQIGLRTDNVFSRLLCLGICIKMAVQVLLNIAVVTNTVPNTGISLPFFSYGGSSLVMMFFEMGIIMSVSRNAKITK